jgi:hypothetical protein
MEHSFYSVAFPMLLQSRRRGSDRHEPASEKDCGQETMFAARRLRCSKRPWLGKR